MKNELLLAAERGTPYVREDIHLPYRYDQLHRMHQSRLTYEQSMPNPALLAAD